MHDPVRSTCALEEDYALQNPTVIPRAKLSCPGFLHSTFLGLLICACWGVPQVAYGDSSSLGRPCAYLMPGSAGLVEEHLFGVSERGDQVSRGDAGLPPPPFRSVVRPKMITAEDVRPDLNLSLDEADAFHWAKPAHLSKAVKDVTLVRRRVRAFTTMERIAAISAGVGIFGLITSVAVMVWGDASEDPRSTQITQRSARKRGGMVGLVGSGRLRFQTRF